MEIKFLVDQLSLDQSHFCVKPTLEENMPCCSIHKPTHTPIRIVPGSLLDRGQTPTLLNLIQQQVLSSSMHPLQGSKWGLGKGGGGVFPHCTGQTGGNDHKIYVIVRETGFLKIFRSRGFDVDGNKKSRIHVNISNCM